ncbi:hypothetical protein HHK36_016474 [Tetracentron sinense]|uniref:Uncharacterized protein n=1 Tax=Tetracentron sinense TaxID=13715 RepID=A0A834Z0T1_TETSI|nr:hypothetical protein HHK36_016474 [Tetracentron sinense]
MYLREKSAAVLKHDFNNCRTTCQSFIYQLPKDHCLIRDTHSLAVCLALLASLFSATSLKPHQSPPPSTDRRQQWILESVSRDKAAAAAPPDVIGDYMNVSYRSVFKNDNTLQVDCGMLLFSPESFTKTKAAKEYAQDGNSRLMHEAISSKF